MKNNDNSKRNLKSKVKFKSMLYNSKFILNENIDSSDSSLSQSNADFKETIKI